MLADLVGEIRAGKLIEELIKAGVEKVSKRAYMKKRG